MTAPWIFKPSTELSYEEKVREGEWRKEHAAVMRAMAEQQKPWLVEKGKGRWNGLENDSRLTIWEVEEAIQDLTEWGVLDFVGGGRYNINSEHLFVWVGDLYVDAAPREKWVPYHQARDRISWRRGSESRWKGRKRRAELMRATAAPGSKKAWRALADKINTGFVACGYCGDRAQGIDHIVPLARGGTHREGNWLAACSPCNLAKRDMLLIEWRRKMQAGEDDEEDSKQA